MIATEMKIQKWFWFALLGNVLVAPNSMLMRSVVQEVDPFLANAIRFTAALLITIPAIQVGFKRLQPKGLRKATFAAFSMTLAMTLFVKSLEYSPASYASVILLLSPIFLILISVRLTGEKISQRAVAGITLAALGASLIVLIPLALHSGRAVVDFYPLATLMLLGNCVLYPLSVVQYKQANEDYGVPMMALVGYTAMIAIVFNLALWFLTGAEVPESVSKVNWAAIIYSGIMVNAIGKILNVKSFEHIGSAVAAALSYMGSFMAILLPIVFLNEQLSFSTAIGGILILFGVYLTEHHKLLPFKHHHLFKGH